MTTEELMIAVSKIKDACEAYERLEESAEWAINKVIDLVGPIDTTPVE